MPEEEIKEYKDQDKVSLKGKRGSWIRFLKLFPKCRLPWIPVVAYVALTLGRVNLGISVTELTASLFAGDTSAELLFKLIIAIIGNLLLTNFISWFGSITSALINRNMRGVLSEKVLSLPISFFGSESPREAVYRIVNNAGVIDSTLMLVLIPLITSLYTSVAIFGKVFDYDYRLSIILIVFIPIQILVAFIFGRINFFLSDRSAYIEATMTDKLAELVTNIPLAKVFARETAEEEKAESIVQRLYKINIKGSWVDQIKDFSDTLIEVIQAAIMLAVGYKLLGSGAIDQRAWIAFFLFSSLFTGAVTDFLMYYNNLKNIQGGADRVAEIMDAEPEDLSGESCADLTGDIEINNLTFGYLDGKKVMDGLSLTIKDNCVNGLIGESGTGKTTLINLILRLYTPESGDIKVGGRSAYDYALEEYRSNFAVIPQDAMMFSGSIFDNVRYGHEGVSYEAFTEALKKAGAYDFVMGLPEKEWTELSEYGNNLSGGQRQRLAAARALLSDAHYMILDEPTAAMDAAATNELLENFRQMAEDRCLIIITHDPSALKICDNVVRLAPASQAEETAAPAETPEGYSGAAEPAETPGGQADGEEVRHE